MSNIKIIECSNKNSVMYNAINASSRSTVNSQWENNVNIELNEGDQIMIESSVINL